MALRKVLKYIYLPFNFVYLYIYFIVLARCSLTQRQGTLATPSAGLSVSCLNLIPIYTASMGGRKIRIDTNR